MENKVTVAAHRGWRGKYPENTMLGFREALKLDIDAIEMDVHMTKDYHIVICHDANLGRTTDTKGIISQMTLDEVRKADAGIKFGEEFKGEKVPTFEEFLELMATRPDIHLLLELKDYPEELGDFAYASAELTLSLCRQYGQQLVALPCGKLPQDQTVHCFFHLLFLPFILRHGSQNCRPYERFHANFP